MLAIPARYCCIEGGGLSPKAKEVATQDPPLLAVEVEETE